MLGLALGAVGVRALLAVNPGNIPRIGRTARPSRWIGPCSASPCCSRWSPAFFSGWSRRSTLRAPISTTTLKEAGARSGSGLRQNKTRSLLVIAEMALAIVLLIGAGLLIRTFSALHAWPRASIRTTC